MKKTTLMSLMIGVLCCSCDQGSHMDKKPMHQEDDHEKKEMQAPDDSCSKPRSNGGCCANES